jgi:multidrug efflux pump subunit AcrA (membrane-fusion protein)
MFVLKRMTKAISVAAIFSSLFILAACSTSASDVEPTPTPLPTPVVPEKPTYTVQRGTVTKSLEFTGRVAPVNQQDLFFRTDGFVRNVKVQRNDQVKAGDLLADLEIGDLENQLAEAQLKLKEAERTSNNALADAEAELEKARLQLQKKAAEDVKADVVAKEIALQNAQDQRKYAYDEYDKAKNRPWEDDDVTERYHKNFVEADRNLTVAQAEYEQALASQKTYVYDIALLRQDVAQAERKVNQIKAEGGTPLEVEQAELEVKKIADKIAAATVNAPFDGKVLSLNIRPGNSVEAFKTIAVVGDPQALELTAELEASDVAELSLDMPASVRLRNRPNEDLQAFVRQLPFVGGTDTSTTGNTDKAVHVALKDTNVALEPGELATVLITLEQKDNALWLPPAAIRTFQGRDFVVIQEGATQRRVDVKLGIKGEDRVEVLEGVQEGQIVVGQ